MATPTSGSTAAAGNGTAKTSGGRKKHVASAAGAARYHKPIGSEIGGARDANHAAIQNDTGARGNYDKLISGDQAAPAALDGMSTEDLNKLADISFSFKSSNAKVVALRIAARNAQARRGIKVPVGQTQTYKTGAPAKAAPSKGKVHAMANEGANQRLIELVNARAEADKKAGRGTTSTGSFPVNSPKQVRDAQRAIGRAKPEQRPVIARHIIAQAQKLKCSHMISDATKHYARGARQPGSTGFARTSQGALELAGHWKHGYIPLDDVALQSKMKGGKGKKWWGSNSAGGTSGNLHGSPKSGSPQRSGGPVKNPHTLSPAQKEQGRQEANARRASIGQAPRPAPGNKGSSTAATRAAATRRKNLESVRGIDSGRTNVVNSGSAASKPRGAAVNQPLSPHRQAMADAINNPTPEFKKNLAEMKANPKNQAAAAKLKADKPVKTTPKMRELLQAGAAHPQGEVHVRNIAQGESLAAQGLTKKTGAKIHITDKGRAHVAGATKPTPGTTGVTDVNKLSSGSPATLASRYREMHGTAGARQRMVALEKKKNPSPRDREMLAAFKSMLGQGGASAPKA